MSVDDGRAETEFSTKSARLEGLSETEGVDEIAFSTNPFDDGTLEPAVYVGVMEREAVGILDDESSSMESSSSSEYEEGVSEPKADDGALLEMEALLNILRSDNVDGISEIETDGTVETTESSSKSSSPEDEGMSEAEADAGELEKASSSRSSELEGMSEAEADAGELEKELSSRSSEFEYDGVLETDASSRSLEDEGMSELEADNGALETESSCSFFSQGDGISVEEGKIEV